MHAVRETAKDLVISSLPLAFATYLSWSTLFRAAHSDAKHWEPTFYSFLPMCFFFVSLAIFVGRRDSRREIRELRDTIAKLRG
jgi:hypothetical protein